MASSAKEAGTGPCETEGCEVVIRGLEDGWPDTSGRLACRRCWDHWIENDSWPDYEVNDGE